MQFREPARLSRKCRRDDESMSNSQRMALKRNRFRMNVILASLLIAIVFTWFYVHIWPYLDIVLIGGVALVMSLWTVLRTFVKDDFDNSAALLKRGVLTSTGATAYLLLLIGMSAVVLVTTSSLYVHWSGGTVTEGAIDAFDSSGAVFVRRLTASPARPIDGQPLLLRVTTKTLHLRVAEPFGYEEMIVTLFPGQKLQVEFPHAFRVHKYRLVRVIPDLTWFQSLSLPARNEIWDMTVRGAHGTCVIHNLKFEPIYIGASVPEVRRLLPSVDAEAFRIELTRYLLDQDVPRTDAKTYIDAWLRTARVVGTGEFRPGERIQITITARGRKSSSVTALLTDKDVQTIIVPKQL